jgi:hypothetical protein
LRRELVENLPDLAVLVERLRKPIIADIGDASDLTVGITDSCTKSPDWMWIETPRGRRVHKKASKAAAEAAGESD